MTREVAAAFAQVRADIKQLQMVLYGLYGPPTAILKRLAPQQAKKKVKTKGT